MLTVIVVFLQHPRTLQSASSYIIVPLINQCYFPGFFVVCQVFSVGVLLSIGVTVMIMAMIFLRAAGQQNWSYWVLSTVLALLMSISSKFTP